MEKKIESKDNAKITKRHKELLYAVFLIGFLGLVLIFACKNTTAGGTGNFPSPEIGDWLIDNETRVWNETIVITGNLSVEDGGNLTFRNVTLKMNCSYDGEFGIEVKDGGKFFIYDYDDNPEIKYDRSNITANNTEYEFKFLVNSGVEFVMRNSELSECGYVMGTSGKGGLTIKTDNTTIENSYFYNNYEAIYLLDSKNNEIINNTIYNNIYSDSGIRLSNSTSNVILNNNISNNFFGIYLYYSINNIIEKNCIINNTFAGIHLSESNNNKVFNNSLFNNTDNCIYIHNSNNNQISNNNISNTNFGIFLSTFCNNNQISKNFISNNDVGVKLWNSCDNNQITNNNIINNDRFGIDFSNSGNNSHIRYNNISGNGWGVYSSSNNQITNNYVFHNYYGISLDNNNQILNNTIFDNYYGIYLWHSNNNQITNNIIFDNNYGLYLRYSSNNQIVNSTISNSSSKDFYFSYHFQNSNITAINTSFNKYKIGFKDDISKLIVKWHLSVQVLDKNHNPIPNAKVRIQDNQNGTYDERYLTDSEGWVTWIDLTEYVQDKNGRTYYTPYTIWAEKDGMWNETILNLNESKEITIILENYWNINLSITTNKKDYALGEKITIIFTNTGVVTLEGTPGLHIEDENGEIVKSFDIPQYIKSLLPGKSINFNWDQKDDNEKELLEGKYIAFGSFGFEVNFTNFWIGTSFAWIEELKTNKSKFLIGEEVITEVIVQRGNDIMDCLLEGKVILKVLDKSEKSVSQDSKNVEHLTGSNSTFFTFSLTNQGIYTIEAEWWLDGNKLEDTKEIEVTVQEEKQLKPDLLITPNDISLSPSSPIEGNKIRIYATIKNIGNTDTKANVTFYLDKISLENQIDSIQPISVLAGKTDGVYVDWICIVGEHKIYVEITDPYPEESNTTNNIAYKTINTQKKIKEPDLTLTSSDIWIEGILKVKETVKIKARIHNYGDIEAIAKIKIYDGEPKKDESNLIGFSTISIPPNGNYTITEDWTLLIEGNHTIYVIIDNCEPQESNTKNNQAKKTVYVEEEDKKERSYIPSTETIALGTVIAIGAIGAFFLVGTEIGLYKLYIAIFLPLYFKLTKKDIEKRLNEDKFTIGSIFGYIKAFPGASYTEIKKAMELNNGTTTHHLNRLEKMEFIKSIRIGKYKHFYPAKMKISDKEMKISKIQQIILRKIEEKPGISQVEVASQVGISKQLANYHIRFLSKMESPFIRVEKKGRNVRCYLYLENGEDLSNEDIDFLGLEKT